jgi:integrase
VPVKLIKRHGVWHIDDTLGPPGRRVHVRQSTKTTDKAKAQRYATDIEGKIWNGHFDGPTAILTFAEAVKLYRSAGKDNKFLGPVEAYLKDWLVKDIKPSTLKQMAIELFPGNSGASMNRRALTPAQSVINHCAEAELCPPMMIKNRFEEDGEPKEPATMEWINRFRETSGLILGNYALFMILTGCRPSEALAVDPVRDLDLEARTVIIRNKKERGQHKGKRKAHLPAMLVAALANMPIEPGRPLFWYRSYNSVTWPWNQAIKRAGIERLTPHCCRHGCVTQLLRRGIDPVTVGWLVDMTAEMVIETYGHAMKDATLTDRIIDTPLTRAISEVAENIGKTGTYGK